MAELSSEERAVVERAGGEPVLDQVLAWSGVNSASRNLAGLDRVSSLLADACAVLPGELRFEEPAPVEAIDSAGHVGEVVYGKHLHLRVRPEAPVQLLFTGHMDTVFGVDHAF